MNEMTKTNYDRLMKMHTTCEREYRKAGKIRQADAAAAQAAKLAANYPQFAK